MTEGAALFPAYFPSFNRLPNSKFLDWSKLKLFTDDKINVTQNLKFVFRRVENSVGNGENAGYQHFLLFSNCFQKPSFSGSLKVKNILDRSKIKAFTDIKILVTGKSKFGMGRIENMVGKGENAGYQHFLLFPHCFQKPSFSRSLKVGIVW